MNERTTTRPENVTLVARARLCANGAGDPEREHFYDTTIFNGQCACGEQGGAMLADLLPRDPSVTEKMAVVAAADALADPYIRLNQHPVHATLCNLVDAVEALRAKENGRA